MNLFGIVALASSGTQGGGQGTGTGTGSWTDMIGAFLPILLMIVVFYFLLIRPQKKREKEKRAMLDALKVGDKVVTIGGICGKVSKIKDSYVFIETGNLGTEDQKSTLKMERSSIATVEQKEKN